MAENPAEYSCHSGAMRQHRTRNLEIPGLVLAHHPGMTVFNT
jgi:hypothetical protein